MRAFIIIMICVLGLAVFFISSTRNGSNDAQIQTQTEQKEQAEQKEVDYGQGPSIFRSYGSLKYSEKPVAYIYFLLPDGKIAERCVSHSELLFGTNWLYLTWLDEEKQVHCEFIGGARIRFSDKPVAELEK